MNPDGITIDNRVGAVELAKHLPPSLTRVQRLEFADIAFFGNGPNENDPGGEDIPVPVGIERKALPDFINSMEDGRLAGHQLLGLRSHYQVVYLLIEGNWRAGADGVLEVLGMGGAGTGGAGGRKGKGSGRKTWRPYSYGGRFRMYRDIVNYANSLAIVCGVRVWRTSGIKESAEWILSTYRWWQKPWREHRSHLRFVIGGPASPLNPDNPVALSKPNLMRRIAKELPGIGWEKSKALAAAFPTPMDLVLATESDLLAVPGIGKELAGRIVTALQGG